MFMFPIAIETELVRPGEKCFLFPSGQKMYLNSSRLLDRMLIGGENINPFLTSSLKQYIRSKKDVFLDIGANHGFFSIYAKFLSLAPSVVAVEPSRREVAQFQRNISLNRVELVLHQCGVGKEESERVLNLALDSNPGANSFQSDWLKDRDIFKPQMTRIRPIRTILAKKLWERTRVIKIDTEGMETEILSNLPWKILSDVVIVAELSPSKVPHEDIDSIYRFMENLGMTWEYGINYKCEQYEEVFRKKNLPALSFDAKL